MVKETSLNCICTKLPELDLSLLFLRVLTACSPAFKALLFSIRRRH